MIVNNKLANPQMEEWELFASFMWDSSNRRSEEILSDLWFDFFVLSILPTVLRLKIHTLHNVTQGLSWYWMRMRRLISHPLNDRMTSLRLNRFRFNHLDCYLHFKFKRQATVFERLPCSNSLKIYISMTLHRSSNNKLEFEIALSFVCRFELNLFALLLMIRVVDSRCHWGSLISCLHAINCFCLFHVLWHSRYGDSNAKRTTVDPTINVDDSQRISKTHLEWNRSTWKCCCGCCCCPTMHQLIQIQIQQQLATPLSKSKFPPAVDQAPVHASVIRTMSIQNGFPLQDYLHLGRQQNINQTHSGSSTDRKTDRPTNEEDANPVGIIEQS